MRRPSRHGGGVSKTQSFSSFGRSISRIASTKRKTGMLKSHQKDLTESPGNVSAKNKMKEKIVQSGSSSEDEGEETVQADFSFFDPKPDDFHGVKMLLQNYLDRKQRVLDAIFASALGGTCAIPRAFRCGKVVISHAHSKKKETKGLRCLWISLNYQ